MENSECFKKLISYINACCIDGVVNPSELKYLIEEAEKCNISKSRLMEEINNTLKSFGNNALEGQDKNIIISLQFFNEALKHKPNDKQTFDRINEIIDSLSEDEILNIAENTINGFDTFNNIVFGKLKKIADDYNTEKDEIKAIKFYQAAIKIKPNDQPSRYKLNHLLKRSGFEISKPGSGMEVKEEGIFLDLKHWKDGGMARIFLAELNDPNDRYHGQKIIIKRIIPEKKDDKEYIKLFYKEYNIGRSLKHKNIIEVIKKGNDKEGEFYYTEYIDGKNLEELIKDYGLQKEDGYRNKLKYLLNEILEGVSYIHKKGIIHRDLKPANILISEATDAIKIIDFGLANSPSYRDDLKTAGTVPYSAPEQIASAAKATKRSDIYSFGIILLELINGKYTYNTTEGNINIQLSNLSDILPHLYKIINKCADVDTKKRYDSVYEIQEEFKKEEIQNELKLCSEYTIEEIKKIKGKKLTEEEPDKLTEEEEKEKEKEEKHKKQKSIIIKIISLSVIIIGIALFFVFIKLPPEVNPNKLTFEPSAGENLNIKIIPTRNLFGQSDLGWSIDSDLSWLEFSNYDGNGKSEVNVKVKEPNISIKARIGSFNVEFDNNIVRSIEVVQMGLLPKLKAKPGEIHFNYKAGDTTIEIKSNLTWIVSEKPKWITVDKMKGDKNGYLIITTTDNDLSVARKGKIKLKAVDKEKEAIINVEQEGHAILEIDKTTITLNLGQNSNQPLVITSNTSWEIIGLPGISIDPAEGSENQLVTISITDHQLKADLYSIKINTTKGEHLSKDVNINVIESDRWEFKDLVDYLNSIKGTNPAINWSYLFQYIATDCKVYYYFNGEITKQYVDIRTYINNIKLGSEVSVINNSIDHDNGTIKEFGQLLNNIR